MINFNRPFYGWYVPARHNAAYFVIMIHFKRHGAQLCSLR